MAPCPSCGRSPSCFHPRHMQVRGSLSYVGPHIVRFRVTKSKSLGLTTAWHDASRNVHSSAQHHDSRSESRPTEACHASSKNGYFISQRARVPLRGLRKTPPIWSIRGHVLSPFDGMHVNVLCASERTEHTENQSGAGILGVNTYVHGVTWKRVLGRSTFRRHRRDRPELCLPWCWCVTARCSCGPR